MSFLTLAGESVADEEDGVVTLTAEEAIVVGTSSSCITPSLGLEKGTARSSEEGDTISCCSRHTRFRGASSSASRFIHEPPGGGHVVRPKPPSPVRGPGGAEPKSSLLRRLLRLSGAICSTTGLVARWPEPDTP
jgi:hypothetical protein